MAELRYSILILFGLSAALLWAGALGSTADLPLDGWWPALIAPVQGGIHALLFHYSLLPRGVVAVLAGASLGLAGGILQHVLRNPLASPSTLGLSAGAQLALALALLWAPDLICQGRSLVAMAGGAASVSIVLLLARRSGFAPVTVLLAGIVMALFAGTLAAGLVLFHDQTLGGLFIWGSGSLVQQDWNASHQLLAGLLLATLLLALFWRPLAMLDLGATAGALGVSVARTRFAGIGIAVLLTGLVVGNAGVIGFVGLAAPAICRGLGFRRSLTIAAASAPVGGLLLSVTDSTLQILQGYSGLRLPTGGVTALLGAPLLIIMVRRMRQATPPANTSETALPRSLYPWLVCGLLFILILTAVPLSLTFNVLPDGQLGFPTLDQLHDLLPWRWPRVFASLAAGSLLAGAGLLLQRMTGNPAASPELLGVSSGAALGLVGVIFLVPAPGYWTQFAAAAAGSGLVLLLLLLMISGQAASGARLLLTGVAIGAAISALLTILLASGDPRMLLIANWMAGSTYDVEPETALGLAASSLVLVGLASLTIRWLELLPLGPAVALQVGVPVNQARLILLCLSAVMTAAATLAVGPLSFVGLLAPHLAARFGLSRALPNFIGTIFTGAAIIVLADWGGRNLYFPFQIPTGLLASLLGSPALFWLLLKRS